MKSEINIAPKNALLLIMDLEHGVIPEKIGGHLVVATSSCIVIGTMSEIDGETNLVLTDKAQSQLSDPNMLLVYTGTLDTPRKRVDVCNVQLDCVLSVEVESKKCHIELWANDKKEPNKICIRIQ